MLSQNLQTLAKHFRTYAADGMEIQPSGVVMICAILEAAVEDAEELEVRAVPQIDQLADELPENVTRLTPREGVKVACFSPRPSTSGPEDAA